MMSKIEWTERTWNPVTGCDLVSPGCANCYAKTMSRRLCAMGVPEYRRGFEVAVHPHKFDLPRAVKKPTMWFVNSMSDFFHEKVTHEERDAMMAVMRETPHHTYQILTKRADVMADYFRARMGARALRAAGKSGWHLPLNVWWGVSVENRKYGIPRIKKLQQIGRQYVNWADESRLCWDTVFFLSCEPLLEDLGRLPLAGISWVIVGGESGHRARPMKKEWVERIERQCHTNAGRIPFFFKQWGEYGADGVRRGKKANGRLLDGVEYNEMPVILV